MIKAVLIALLLAFATPSLAMPRVTVHCEPGLESTARALQAGAEDALARISTDLVDLPEPREIHVELVRDSSSLAQIVPSRGAPPWAAGIAYPDLGIIGVATRRGAEWIDPLPTLRHELAHIALGAALGPRAPRWLHEGFANQHAGEWSWDRAETLAGMAWFHSIVPLDDLDRSFPAEEIPANRAYAEAYDFVGYLSRRGVYEDSTRGDRWPFRRFLTALGHGSDIDAAAMHAFGRPIHVLFEEWREDISKRYFMAPIGLFGLALWVGCAILLAFAWRRKRRLNRRRMAQWDREERAYDAAQAAEAAMALHVDDDDDPPPRDPELIN